MGLQNPANNEQFYKIQTTMNDFTKSNQSWMVLQNPANHKELYKIQLIMNIYTKVFGVIGWDLALSYLALIM